MTSIAKLQNKRHILWLNYLKLQTGMEKTAEKVSLGAIIQNATTSWTVPILNSRKSDFMSKAQFIA